MSLKLLHYPVPFSITYMWNWGSLLMMSMMIQVFTGILLTFHYSPTSSFQSIQHLLLEVSWGFLLQHLHLGGASLLFLSLYMHLFRGMFKSSSSQWKTWFVGVLLLFLMMGEAFLGYVLPVSNMSLWAGMVITSLLSVLPFVGNDVLYWLWSGFGINNYTINMFFSLHYLLPIIILCMVGLHILCLHKVGATSKTGSIQYSSNLPFSLFILKDMMNILFMLMCLILLLLMPLIFSDPDMSEDSSSIKSPVHITPESYFLFAYSILRSVESKLGGVLLLVMSLLVLFLLPLGFNKSSQVKWVLGMLFLFTVLILSWLGTLGVEYPYSMLSPLFTTTYFLVVMLWIM